jgi:hypothetical protein
MTWLIEEMPHDDVASFCLATPWHYVLGEGSRCSTLYYEDDDIRYMPWFGLNYNEKDRFLLNVAIVDNNLYYAMCLNLD